MSPGARCSPRCESGTTRFLNTFSKYLARLRVPNASHHQPAAVLLDRFRVFLRRKLQDEAWLIGRRGESSWLRACSLQSPRLPIETPISGPTQLPHIGPAIAMPPSPRVVLRTKHRPEGTFTGASLPFALLSSQPPTTLWPKMVGSPRAKSLEHDHVSGRGNEHYQPTA